MNARKIRPISAPFSNIIFVFKKKDMGNRWKVYIVSFLVLLCVSCNPKGRIDENDIYKKIEKYERGERGDGGW